MSPRGGPRRASGAARDPGWARPPRIARRSTRTERVPGRSPVPAAMNNRLPSRRNLFEAAQRYLLEPGEEQLERVAGEPPRLTSQAIQKVRMSRSRERILANLDDMYREAFERAKTSGDDTQMASLDFA